MCGRYNVTDNLYVRELMKSLGMPLYPQDRLNVAPLSAMEFVYQDQNGRHLIDGFWSVLIEHNPNTGNYRQIKNAQGRPLSTFNAASRNLRTSRLWKPLFKNKRSIIPISGFHEWSMWNGNKTCFNIESADGSAIAMGGLYDFKSIEGEAVPVTASITLPSHDKFMHIHKKSIPLMLQPDDFEMWLDHEFTNTKAFEDLLQSTIKFDWKVTPVDSPATLTPIGESEIIKAD
ncbi:SOS response-associated peptidase family protein [Aliikangiella coralliicola]|uniref:Abasic site processing protein n=1 Tax=Aliikangiella coralliicola TaxID=2592383 RepID=A0A545UD20_9GAMM|nr:SOS response-associated peptidase family protein [Aliikangiella coralliicola]TQV87369.1 SOS response-associated peptidase [Aliikangiella coralliicola]